MDIDNLLQRLRIEIGAPNHPLAPDNADLEFIGFAVRISDRVIHSIELYFSDEPTMLFEEISVDSHSTLESLLFPPHGGMQLILVSDVREQQWDRSKVSVHYYDGEDLVHLFYARAIRRADSR